MKITISGKPATVDDGTTVAQLIVDQKVENPDYVTVVVNDDFVDQADFAATVLEAGDVVEFLYLMGGGR